MKSYKVTYRYNWEGLKTKSHRMFIHAESLEDAQKEADIRFACIKAKYSVEESNLKEELINIIQSINVKVWITGHDEYETEIEVDDDDLENIIEVVRMNDQDKTE